MNFVKMHGIGNDYIYFDAVTNPAIEKRFASSATVGSSAAGRKLIERMSNRNTGIGSDGVILVAKPTAQGNAAGAHVRMRMFNADGSEGIMCGNGIRCVAKFAHDRLGVRATPMLIETRRGVLSIDYRVARHLLIEATVDMGQPILDLKKIPVRESRLAFTGVPHHWGITVDRLGTGFAGTFVSMGNPHVVIFENGSVDFKRSTLASLDLPRIGPEIEGHSAFPDRMNVHFAASISRSHVVMRTWERGSGITQACGTGACAVLVAGALTNRLRRSARVTLPGGDLHISWEKSTDHVFMTGPATDAFEGVWSDE